MRIVIVSFLTIFGLLLLAGNDSGPDTGYRVLLVGDSWSDFMWQDRALSERFAAEGRADALEKGDVTAISGSTAAEWATPSFLTLITDELIAHPTIHLVQLTIGGNDFLAGQSGGGWFVTMTPEEEELLLDRVTGDTLTVIQHIQTLDPGIDIVLSYYDYPNFEDSLSGPLALFCGPTYDDMGAPDTRVLNDALARFADRAEAMAAGLSGVEMVRHEGLMQNHFGFPGQGIPPGQIQPPGDPGLPSPTAAMRFGGFDCIHINNEGNDVIALNLWQNYYAEKLCLTVEMVFERLPQWPRVYTIEELVRFWDQRCN